MRRGLPRRPGARGMARPAALFAALLAGFVLTCAAQADSLRRTRSATTAHRIAAFIRANTAS